MDRTESSGASGTFGGRGALSRPIGDLSGRLAVLVLAGSILSGCTSESGPGHAREGHSDNQPPAVSRASINPPAILLDAPVTVHVVADDPDRDALTFQYRWFVNGLVLEGETASTLSPALLKRGDSVMVEVIPNDGKVSGSVYRTAVATVVNTPPAVSLVSLKPAKPVRGDKLVAEVEATDPDHDQITLTFQWSRNGVVVQTGDAPTFDTAELGAKDEITLEVTAHDGIAKGKSFRGSPLRLWNAPPQIVSKPTTEVLRDRYEYVVNAVDSEGDPITYRLDIAPPGMTIEPETGRLHWTIAPELRGTHRVRIVAEDPQGGTADQDFEITIPPKVAQTPTGT